MRTNYEAPSYCSKICSGIFAKKLLKNKIMRKVASLILITMMSLGLFAQKAKVTSTYNYLKTGDSISTIAYVSGIKVDGTTSDLTLGAPVSSGTQVIFSCTGGTAFNKYRVEAEINTTLGEILDADGYLRVVKY